MRNIVQDIKLVKKPINFQKEIKGERSVFEKSFFEDKKINQDQKSFFSDLNSKKTKSKNLIIWIILIVSLFFILFSISALFYRANVEINSREEVFEISKNLEAIKGDNNELAYETMVLEGEEKKDLEANIIKQMEEKASGKVIIYNNYSSAVQKLATDTRLLATNGKIYKVFGAVTIPGMTTDKNNQKIPGSLEVTVFAENAGEEYNSTLTDFKILGFKNTSKYAKFYGRSKTEITGGIKGEVKTVAEEILKEEKEKLIQNLKTKLIDQAAAQIPDNFVLFKEAVSFEITEFVGRVDTTSDTNNSLPLSVKGKLTAIIFNKENLTEKIKEGLVKEEENVKVQNWNDLVFAINNQTEFLEEKEVNFSLAGKLKIVWQNDSELIKDEILGKSRIEAENILNNYAGQKFESYKLTIRPFWQRFVPDNRNKIVINIKDVNK